MEELGLQLSWRSSLQILWFELSDWGKMEKREKSSSFTTLNGPATQIHSAMHAEFANLAENSMDTQDRFVGAKNLPWETHNTSLF